MTARGGPVDRTQLRALLVAYWRMTRRGRVAAAMGARNVRTPGAALPLALGMYGLMGALMGALLVGSSSPLLFGFVLHVFTLLASGLAVTIESGEILFSRVENDVLGHRPVAPATLLLAKGIHLFAFGLLVAGAINAIPALIGLGLKGVRPWFPLAHLVASAGQTAFLCAGVVFLHGAVARLVGRERFEAVATWAQVGLSVLFVIGYQLVTPLVARLGDRATLPPLLLLLAPPGWFAALGAVLGGAGTPAVLPAAAAGVLVTAALSRMAVRHLSAGYAERLTSLDEAKARPGRAAGVPKRSRFGRVVRSWIRDPVERAAFGLAAATMARDRETKLRLYPSLAGILVVPVLAFVDSRHGTSGGRIYGLFGFAMVALLSVSVVETLRVSSQHAAADVFRMAPLASACGLFHGVRKAALLYVTLPAGLAMATLVAFTFRGGRDGLIAGIPMILAIPTISLLPGVAGDYVPLSRPVTTGEAGSQAVVLMFGGMIVMGILGVVGFLASRANVVVPVAAGEIAILGLVHAAASRVIRSRPFAAD